MPRQTRYVLGKVDYVHPNYAYILPEHDDMEDIWVRQEDLLLALHNDLVEVMIIKAKKNGKRPVGKVVRIIERRRASWVGRIVQDGQEAFVITTSRRMHHNIFVRPENLQGAKKDDKVIVVLNNEPSTYKKLEGKVKQVLGEAGTHEVEMQAIMAEFNLPTSFPCEVLVMASTIPPAIPARELTRRRDFTDVSTFTIDPADAQDFDDALSFQALPNGHYEVGIHIADVSFYVQEGSLIDQEAFERNTSVYLVDRTIPMLPERLSNDLCSLKPHESRLTFSAVFELDSTGKIYQEWFGETIIHSDKRFTYEEAQEAITRQQGVFYQELTVLNQLAKQLRTERLKKGAINFEMPEVRFQLDEYNKPLSIIPKLSQDTHKLIEEFMLLANRRVAKYVHRMRQDKSLPTFVYRTHDKPDLEKLEDLARFVKQFGYVIKTNPTSIASSLNTLTENILGKPEARIIQSLAIRIMPKALYTTASKPHFGLAFQQYTHFTSPIRRYPDLMVHRLLKRYLQSEFKFEHKIYEQKCQYASERERMAAEIERASIKYKQVELIQALHGEVMRGVISSIVAWGIYVELVDSLCEGMVRLADMTEDYYVLDEKKFRVIGQRTKRIYQLGDQVYVKIKSCDLNKRIIDLSFVSYNNTKCYAAN